MTNQFDIQPYIGSGPLKFKMKPDDVIKILGKPEDIDSEPGEELREYRVDNGLQTVYSNNSVELIEIGFSSNLTGLSFKGVKLFQEPAKDILNILVSEDKNPYVLFGFIVLLNLGITLTGFHDSDENQKAVTVFANGRWDSMKDELIPFKLG